MEDSEKLTALKKVYADIILNTAKEAAVRIMASERKAMRFQQELVSTKEEALQMLLRLKQTLDSKVNAAEMMSLSQQKKIEELEAQLQEAEEIVRDLRAELRETQAELERVTNNQMHPPVEQNIEGEIAPQENFLPEERLDTYDRSVYSVSDLPFESVAIHETRNSTVNGTNDSCKLCVPHDHINNCYIHNPDFASIVIRRKEPELYRNGCTQRIRAFERSLFDGNMSLSGNVGDVQNETLVKVDEEGKVLPVTTNAKADNLCEIEKQDEPKVVNADVDHVKVPVHRKKRRFRTRKAFRSRLHSDQVKETNKASHFSCTNGSPCVLDTDDPSRDNSSTVCENEAQKDQVSPLAEAPTDETAMIDQSGSHNDTKKEEAFLEACSAWKKIKDDKELIDKSDLTRQESLSTESLEVPACRTDFETANESSDPKVSDLDEKVSSQSVNGKFLKYTFRRKRKKESVSIPDMDCSLESSSLKKKCGEKQNGHVEPQKSCTITESSRDSRRLAQVARQLISLSEKKWWQ